MGSITEPVLKLCGFQTYRIERRGGGRGDHRRRVPHGVWRRQYAGRDTAVAAHGRSQQAEEPLTVDRRALVARLLDNRGNLMVITGIGSSTYDVAACGDHPLNFYIWSGLGCTPSVGLGLALAQPDRRVAMVTGDGDMLMALGASRPSACKQPKNLCVVCLDNGHYSATGMQPSATSAGIDLAAGGNRLSAPRRSRVTICPGPTNCERCCTQVQVRSSFTLVSTPTIRSALSQAATGSRSNTASCRRRGRWRRPVNVIPGRAPHFAWEVKFATLSSENIGGRP